MACLRFVGRESQDLKLWSPNLNFVRYRYHADKIKNGPLVRRYGYEERIVQGGMLPRSKDFGPLPMPRYRPKDAWSEKRALFGQNDYIDILGNEKLHPTRVLYHLPSWIRGFGGNEFQCMLRKQKMLHFTDYPTTQPTQWNNLSKRVRYLYRFYNRKTKNGWCTQ